MHDAIERDNDGVDAVPSCSAVQRDSAHRLSTEHAHVVAMNATPNAAQRRGGRPPSSRPPTTSAAATGEVRRVAV